MFSLTPEPIAPEPLRAQLLGPRAGGFVSFEGWVRDHNEGKAVLALEYEAYAPLALKEGQRIVAEALERFAVEGVVAVHRVGALKIGDMAVWVGVSAAHRDAAFEAARYVIDEIKTRVPVWKREHYADGTVTWVDCSGCAHPHR